MVNAVKFAEFGMDSCLSQWKQFQFKTILLGLTACNQTMLLILPLKVITNFINNSYSCLCGYIGLTSSTLDKNKTPLSKKSIILMRVTCLTDAEW